MKKKESAPLINDAIIPERSIIVVGLSGGPDSVYLLHQLAALKKSGHITEIIAAHLDHEWRTESANDSVFCADLAKKYGLPFVGGNMSDIKQVITWNGSQEEIGRKARQLFLTSVMKEYGADAIALGHHADDQQETFFLRLIRGTSLTGLCGMMPKSGPYIRPLLALSKREIVSFLDTHKIPYLIDPTNVSPDYLRNRIRTTVLPVLRACDARFDHALLATMGRLQQAEDYFETIALQLFGTISSEHEGILSIDTQAFNSQPTIMQQRLLMIWLKRAHVPFTPTAAFFNEIIKFLAQPTGAKHTVGINWLIAKKKNKATIIKIVSNHFPL